MFIFKYLILFFKQTILLILAFSAFNTHSQNAVAVACSKDKYREVRAAASIENSFVLLDCDLVLDSTDIITKRLILEGSAASGINIDCNNGLIQGKSGTVNQGKDMIEIKSSKSTRFGESTWSRPENIRIQECRINGSVRILGMAKNGEGEILKSSSKIQNHVYRARKNAPQFIFLEKLEITAFGRTNLYIAPGVTRVTLSNSKLDGFSNSVSLYLDAESGFNIIQNSEFHTDTRNGREQLAIDGSSRNLIVNNWFSGLKNGGIYLYRNCGEGGTIRHTTPSSNRIINNVFYYNKYQGSSPSIFVGSRNGNRSYCSKDKGYPFGSSISDLDLANNNVIMQNQIYKRSVVEMIKVGPGLNKNNKIAYNQTVTKADDRLAGCYVPNKGLTNFIQHGQTIDVFLDSNNTPKCKGYQLTCHDASLTYSQSNSCQIQTIDFGCKVSGDNAGCKKVVTCPRGTYLLGAKLACNLEFGTIQPSQVSELKFNYISVLRKSDNTSDGKCFIEKNIINSNTINLSGLFGKLSVCIGCTEYDKNGGDCHVLGQLYCR